MGIMRALLVVVMSSVPLLAEAQPAPTAAQPEPAAAAPPAPIGAAQPAPVAPLPVRERRTWFGGIALFGGNISCDGADCGGFREAGGAAGTIGYLFNPRLDLAFDVWAMTSSKNNVSVSFVTATANVRYYLMPALWVQGGVGSGRAIVRALIFQSRSDDVPVGQLAAGYEVVRGRNWAVDVTFRVAQGGATDRGMDTSDDARTGRSVGLGASLTFFSMKLKP
jgi:hypothetical protein